VPSVAHQRKTKSFLEKKTHLVQKKYRSRGRGKKRLAMEHVWKREVQKARGPARLTKNLENFTIPVASQAGTSQAQRSVDDEEKGNERPSPEKETNSA